MADYGLMYMFGPFLGSLMGGNLYNYIRRLEYRLPRMKTHEEYVKKKKRYSDSETSGTSIRTSELSDTESVSRGSSYYKKKIKEGINDRMGKMRAVERISD